MASLRTNWKVPFVVATPPDDGDLSELPSQVPSQAWEDASSAWRPEVLQQQPQPNLAHSEGRHVTHRGSWHHKQSQRLQINEVTKNNVRQARSYHSQHASYLNSKSGGPSPAVHETSTGMLRPVSYIPEQYRSLFSQFPYFNIVQSTVFQDVFNSERSLVVSAPTGSGKTVVMELALVRLLLSRQQQQQELPALDSSPHARVVYMAPMKAVVTERYMDWRERLAPLGVTCAEVTGDTDHDDISVIKNSQVVLTTPEKWDSLTRRWRDHAALMQAVSLLLIDEVHLLNDETRGPTLEAVVSRMKTIRATRPATHGHNTPALRFIAVSATIPNVEDVAAWLSDDQGPAVSHKLEESLRPVQLRRVVLGYDCREAWTEFRFDISLNYRLPSVISTYSDNKPTLVFVSTRKAAQTTATTLTREARLVRDASHKQHLTSIGNSLRDNKLRECVLSGVGYHHAGLDATDRRHLEQLFMAGQLPVLVATSTLAMGVNLPAHLVVVKSTAQYVNGGYQEYSAAQLLQMMGRAGRPQFDTQATAVIMTKHQHKVKYENLVTGRSLLESHLHLHLVEHLNAEIVLGTVTDLGVAVEWLRSTFLYVRVQHNPRHYRLPHNLQHAQLEAKLQEMCTREVNALAQAGLIVMSEVDVTPTQPGRLMARYCVSFNTMNTFIQLNGDESLKELVEVVSGCREFWDIKVRMSEKRLLNEMNKSQTSSIRFPIKGKIKTREHKINCLVQATLGSQTIVDPGLSQEAIKIMRTGQRITKCLAEYGATRAEYELQLNTTLLNKCFSCRLWENSRHVTRQLEKIGPALSAALVRAKITSFTTLEAASPRDIELILNRQPPFGNRLRDQAVRLPRYELTLQQINKVSVEESEVRVTVCLGNREEVRAGATTPRHHSCRLILGDADNNVIHQQRVTDAALVISGSVSRVVRVVRAHAGVELAINLISETWAGLDVQSSYSPRYLPRSQPIPRAAASTIPAPPPSTRGVGDEEAGSKPSSAAGGEEEGRRACLHTCANKQTCAHKCCKIGVSAKVESSRSGGPAVVQEIRKRSSQLPQTPVKKIKMAVSSETGLSQFKYSSHRPRLMHAPTPIKSTVASLLNSSFQPSISDNSCQPKTIQNVRQSHTTGNKYQANVKGNQPSANDSQMLSDINDGHFVENGTEYLTGELIDEHVLNEFENVSNFGEEETQDFPDMDLFMLEKENYTGEFEASTETYEEAFSEPLGIEDMDYFKENLSGVSWKKYKFGQHHIKHNQNQQLTSRLPSQNPCVPPNMQRSQQTTPLYAGQKPRMTHVKPGQQDATKTNRQSKTQNIPMIQSNVGMQRSSWQTLGQSLQAAQQSSGQTQGQSQQPAQRPLWQTQGQTQQAAQRSPWQTQGQSQQAAQRPQPCASNYNNLLRPRLLQHNQNQRPVKPLGTHINQNNQLVLPLEAKTNQYQCPVRPSGMPNQIFLRPSGIEANYNKNSVRTFGEQTNQTQRPVVLSGAHVNTIQKPLGVQTGQMQRPPMRQGAQVRHIQNPLRLPGPQVGQGQRLVKPPFGQTNNYSSTEASFTETSQTQMPMRPSATHTNQKQLPSFGVQNILSKNLSQPLNNQHQIVSDICINDSLNIEEQGKFQAQHQEQIFLPNQGPEPPGYPAQLYSQRTITPFPYTNVATVQSQEDEHAATADGNYVRYDTVQEMQDTWHPQPGRGSTAHSQQLLQSWVNSDYQRCHSVENQAGSALLTRLNYSQQTPDQVCYSQGSGQIYPSDDLQLQTSNQQTCGTNPYATSGLQHLKPVAGIKPLSFTTGQSNGNRQKKVDDPFSHLTKEWRESQRGRPRNKLGNIFVPTMRGVRSAAEGVAPTKEIQSHKDDWRDLEMFQWCRQQERLALESLYNKGQELTSEETNEPQHFDGDSVPNNWHQTPASSTMDAQTINPGKLHITYGGGQQGPALDVGVTGVGGIQQNINISFSGILSHVDGPPTAPSTVSSPATVSQVEPQVRGILKKPSQGVWSAPPDIFQGIL